jgi:hypothetical protein
MASSNALSSLTEGLDELPYRESSPDDSHCPTTPLPRTFNGELAAEASGKRERPDNTSRGIGPQSIEADARTMDVSSADLMSASKDMSLSELRLPFMHNNMRFLVLIAGGALALVGAMLLLMTRGDQPARSVEKVAVSAPAPALVAEPAPAPEPPAAVAPAAQAEPEQVTPAVTPEKPRAAKHRVRSAKAAVRPTAKLSTRSVTKTTAKTSKAKTTRKTRRAQTATAH